MDVVVAARTVKISLFQGILIFMCVVLYSVLYYTSDCIILQLTRSFPAVN